MSAELKKLVPELLEHLEGQTQPEMIALLCGLFPGKVTFSTSFGFEDQVITHQILSNNLPVSIFTLDTGRLFPETYSVWSRTIERYETKIKAYYPDAEKLQNLIEEKGPNLFYESPENRKDCCGVRKVEPLKRALKGNKIWITGLRAEQSAARQDLQPIEYDEVHDVIKYHPIFNWTTDETRDYINQFNIPYNILHDRGFISIGCAPCTRAIRPGEDFRAGRWWWEDNSKKECGLHVHSAEVEDEIMLTEK
jgi:phosphoadenosine phosphosulfate reductase